MKVLTIIIPVYNEEKTILRILKRIKETKSDNIKYEIIVIDDGSNDKTCEILEENINLYTIFIKNKRNKGKGFVVKEGLKVANGDYIIFQDADQEYDPYEINKFVDMINNYDPDLILGSRFRYDKYTRSYNFLNKIGNLVITTCFNLFYNTTFTDVYCCYACFKKELLDFNQLRTYGFEQHAEILCKIVKKGKKLYEVPVNYNGRTIAEGKKIRFFHMIPVLFQIIKFRLW